MWQGELGEPREAPQGVEGKGSEHSLVATLLLPCWLWLDDVNEIHPWSVPGQLGHWDTLGWGRWPHPWMGWNELSFKVQPTHPILGVSY